MLTIPSKFELLLKKDIKLEAIVKNILADYGDILEENQLFFFEEYTDHGIKHIQQVLNASEDIITEPTIENVLDTEDVFILIISIILHDLGMHTSFATFKAMLEGEYDNVRIEVLDSKKWIELWNDYLDEAKKFSGKQRVRIFGDETQLIKEPDLKKKDNLTGYDKKLIGEFIRRNHPRIAHEVALKGLLGIKGQLIPFAESLDERLKDYKDIAGIVARSHGMAVRNCFEYLQKFSKDEWAQPFSINVVFLMIVIRIADYFQFNAERVSSKTIKLKTFSSPVSEIEFIKHESIKFVKPYVRDNETLHVEANPPSSFILIKLSDLFKDIQKELDLSWAIIGEVYGKEEEKYKPQLKYRRIKSNLEDREVISQFPFIAEKVAFSIDEDLPKLLIAPLYGNDPSYGIRELLQNAIDACKERAVEEEKIHNNTYQGSIKISVFEEPDTSKKIFQIDDNGKGMSLFELRNYFLKAGASFRKSNEWKKKFEGSNGASSVQRSGRFGVGVLAAFLIGNELIITTKSMHESIGYTFNTQLDTEQIEVQKLNSCPTGTVLKIIMNEETYQSLLNEDNFQQDKLELSNYYKEKNKVAWTQWFTLSNPIINFQTKNYESFTPFSNPDPSFEDKEPADWHSFKTENFELIRWTYSTSYTKATLTCNGIIIPAGYDLGKYGLEINHPKVSVFDFSASLNLNLSRNSLINHLLPFEKDLVTEIYKNLIAFILVYTPEVSLNKNKVYLKKDLIKHLAVFRENYYNRVEPYSTIEMIYTETGFTLKNDYCFSKIPYSQLYTIYVPSDLDNNDFLIVPDSFKMLKLNFITTQSLYEMNKVADTEYGGRVIIQKKIYSRLFDKSKPTRIRAALRNQHKVEEDSNGWVKYSYSYNEAVSYQIQDFKNLDSILGIQEKPVEKKYKETLFNSLLELYLGDNVIIPYDLTERKNMLATAFQKLDKYIKLHTP